MSLQTPSRVREWLVPPIVIPLFFGLVFWALSFGVGNFRSNVVIEICAVISVGASSDNVTGERFMTIRSRRDSVVFKH